MFILVLVLWVVWPPPSPPILGGDGSYGYQILPTSLPHETRKKIAPSVRLKSQTVEYYPKIVILGVLPKIVWHPPTPPKLGGDGSCGYQILPTSPLHESVKKRPICWIKESNSWVLARNGYFGVGTWGGLTPPNTPKTWWGWFMWVPNFAHKSFPWDREKNWPMRSM